MSLNFNFEGIKDYENVTRVWVDYNTHDHGKLDEWGDCNKRIHEGKQQVSILNPVTNAIIWATISIGLGEITEDNAAEFYGRVAIIDRLDGPFLIKDGKPSAITPADIKAHIGLTTNVTNETRTQWAKRVIIGGKHTTGKVTDFARIYKIDTKDPAPA